MSNYKQDKVTGWQRSKQVIIKNDYKAIPTIEFSEEMIVEVDGALINKKDVGTVTSSLRDPSVSFPLLNPENDQVIGTGSYGQVYVLLYSVYRYLAEKRDIRELKWALFTTAETEFKSAQAIFDKLATDVANAQAALKKDPTNGTVSKALSDAIYAKDDAAVILDAKKAVYDLAKTEFDVASDYL